MAEENFRNKKYMILVVLLFCFLIGCQEKKSTIQSITVCKDLVSCVESEDAAMIELVCDKLKAAAWKKEENWEYELSPNYYVILESETESISLGFSDGDNPNQRYCEVYLTEQMGWYTVSNFDFESIVKAIETEQ